MYRLLLVMSASALLLALLPFLQTVAVVRHTVGADQGWFSYAPGAGMLVPWPWLLGCLGAAVLLSLAAILRASGLALRTRGGVWLWSLALLLPLGLFGWLAMAFGPFAGATLIFLPPLVTGAFGWQGWARQTMARPHAAG
jgi:hypothetical protein